MDTQKFLSDNRDSIINYINSELKRKIAVCGRAATDLKGAMIVYKEVLESTELEWKAKEAAIKAIRGGIKASKYAHLSDASRRQLSSSMRY